MAKFHLSFWLFKKPLAGAARALASRPVPLQARSALILAHNQEADASCGATTADPGF